MSQSWGHTLQRLTPEQIARLADWQRTCGAGRRCPNPSTHLSTYQYITGKAGRVSWSRRYACDEHAAKFRAKHGLPVPTGQPIPKHALERLIKDGAA